MAAPVEGAQEGEALVEEEVGAPVEGEGEDSVGGQEFEALVEEEEDGAPVEEEKGE